MKWCCEAFQFAFDERHERGIFVFCEPIPPNVKGGLTYWLGMRSVRIADRERLSRHVAVASGWEQPVPITLATWHRIKFCPWCGRGVERFYRNTYQALTDVVLTEEHGWCTEQVVSPGAQESVPR